MYIISQIFSKTEVRKTASQYMPNNLSQHTISKMFDPVVLFTFFDSTIIPILSIVVNTYQKNSIQILDYKSSVQLNMEKYFL